MAAADQVENLASPTSSTDRPTVLSINHNWANSTTVLRMFATLAHDVDACARSIDDVREMLQRARDGRGWEREWAQEVQDLVKRCVLSPSALACQSLPGLSNLTR